MNKLGEELDQAKAELDVLQAEIRDIAPLSRIFLTTACLSVKMKTTTLK